MATYSSPALGLDPAPGDPGAIEAPARDCKRCAADLSADAEELRRLTAHDDWQGAAAEAFAAHHSSFTTISHMPSTPTVGRDDDLESTLGVTPTPGDEVGVRSLTFTLNGGAQLTLTVDMLGLSATPLVTLDGMEWLSAAMRTSP